MKAPQKRWTFSLGKPLVLDTLLVSFGMGVTSLHAWYMGKTNKTRTQCPTGFTVKYKTGHFLHQPGFFVVGFNDLFNLFNLDVSLLRCRTLHMIQEAKRRKEPVGFLDPHLISKQCINDNASYVEDYITTGLYAHNDEYILVLYNQVWHWILIVIVLKWNKVIYIDSLIKSQQDFTLVQQLINRRFAAYIAKRGRHVEGNTTLRHVMQFPCHQ